MSVEGTPEGRALVAASARIGADPLLIQGPGGNTSIKDGCVMWIKASGSWLAEAGTRDVFVPIDWPAYAEALRAGGPAAEEAGAFRPGWYEGDLRPSIETPLHALLPGRVVIHVHCVHTIALAVRADARAALGRRLEGIAWHLVPYARPGLPLVPGVLEGVAAGARAIVLGNHGLVVSADTVAEAEALLAEVHRRLAAPAREVAAPAGDALRRLCEGTAFAPAADPASPRLAGDPRLARIVAAGALYPDHVIFFGMGPPVARSSAEARGLMTGPEPPMAILVPGVGMALRRDASAGAAALLRCLGEVLLRVPPGAAPIPLTPADCDALLNWDAERHRMSLDAERS